MKNSYTSGEYLPTVQTRSNMQLFLSTSRYRVTLCCLYSCMRYDLYALQDFFHSGAPRGGRMGRLPRVSRLKGAPQNYEVCTTMF